MSFDMILSLTKENSYKGMNNCLSVVKIEKIPPGFVKFDCLFAIKNTKKCFIRENHDFFRSNEFQNQEAYISPK